MKLNESTAISTTRALLVPYDPHHVETYHTWMQDPTIQEATASDPLTLEEEYANQLSWRVSPDKLTFIICHPLSPSLSSVESVEAGRCDTPSKMIGDVNFFLYPSDDDEEECVVGEVDIMIAHPDDRGRGLGRAVVGIFLHYVLRNLGSILDEYSGSLDGKGGGETKAKLTMLMAKIKEGNEPSIALFRSLGFTQEGGVNYFGEVKLVLRDFGAITSTVPEGYAELVYSRSL